VERTPLRGLAEAGQPNDAEARQAQLLCRAA
jgi:hypothetical protein